MESRIYPKPDKKPQPKVGMLVAAFVWKEFKNDVKRIKKYADNSDYVKSLNPEPELFRTPVYETEQSWAGKYVKAGAVGIVVKGNGKELFLVAFGGIIGWVRATDIAELNWVERQLQNAGLS